MTFSTVDWPEAMRKRIDYIFLHPGPRVELMSVDTVPADQAIEDSEPASDHLGVLVRLRDSR